MSARENTLEAFQAALNLKVDGIETDVWMTTDDVAVLYHERFAPGGGEVSRMTYAQLCDATNFKVPTLLDALEISNDILWNIELKSPAAVSAVAELVRTRRERQRFLLTSFYHPAVFQLAKLTAVDCGLLISHRPVDVRSLIPSGLSASGGVATIVWNGVYIDRSIVDQARAIGLKSFVYGLENAEDHRTASQWGVDAIITDDPRLALVTTCGHRA